MSLAARRRLNLQNVQQKREVLPPAGSEVSSKLLGSEAVANVAQTHRMIDAMQRKLHDVFHSNVVRVCTFWGLLSVLNDCNICVSPPLLEGALAHTGIAFRCGEDGEGVALDEEKFLRLAEHLMYDPALATSFYDDDRQLVELALKGEAQRGDCHDPSFSAPKSLFESLPDFQSLLAPFHLSANRLSGSGEATDFDFHGFWKNVCGDLDTGGVGRGDGANDQMIWETLSPELREMLLREVSDCESRGSLASSGSLDLGKGGGLSKLSSLVTVRKSFYHTLDFSKAPPVGLVEAMSPINSVVLADTGKNRRAGAMSVAFVGVDDDSSDRTSELITSEAIAVVVDAVAAQCGQALNAEPLVMTADELRQWERRSERQEQAQQQLLTRYQSAFQSFSQRRQTTRLASLTEGLDPSFLHEMGLLPVDDDSWPVSPPGTLTSSNLGDVGDSTNIHSLDPQCEGHRHSSCATPAGDSSTPLGLPKTRSASTVASVSTPQTGRSAVTGRSFARSFRVKVREFQLNDDEKRMLQCKRVQSATLEREVQFLDYDVLRHVGGSAARRVMSMKREMCGGSASPSRLPSAPRSTPSYSAPMSRCSSAKLTGRRLHPTAHSAVLSQTRLSSPLTTSTSDNNYSQRDVALCPPSTALWERWVSGGRSL